MVKFPNAKINLGLFITSKRADGFHNLESIFYPVPLSDGLEILPSSEFDFQLAGKNFELNNDSNLCVKAYQLLKSEFTLPNIQMFLYKKIPVGAGLGGGSSDATSTLKILNELFDLALSNQKVEEYAAQLGSDCPFFVRNTPQWVTGRGEIMQDFTLNLSDLYLSIIHPNVHISTKDAFSMIKAKEAPKGWTEKMNLPISEWKSFLINYFEEPIFTQFPLLKQIKEHLYDAGALYVSMSGSGSAIYALSEHKISLDSLSDTYFKWQTLL